MREVLYVLCQHDCGLMYGWIPLPSTLIAKSTNLSVGQVRYRLKKLKAQGLVAIGHYGGSTEDGEPYCIHGYFITEKAKFTDEFRQAWNEERELCKETLDIDIGSIDEVLKKCQKNLL